MTTTKNAVRAKFKMLDSVRGALYAFCFAFFLVFTAMNAKTCQAAVVDSVEFCLRAIIPSIFPFMVLSDFLASAFSGGKGRNVFTEVLGISPYMSSAFITGNLCGFPIGVRMAARIFSEGKIEKDELEASIALFNNPSCAYVISAVGVCMYDSIYDGVGLYICILSATFIVGIFFREKRDKANFTNDNTGQTFDISESIKNAGLSCVAVSSYIIFFSYISCVLSLLINNDYITAIISAFVEVGSGVKLISALGLPRLAALPLTALALGFSGISVHLQAFGVLPKEIRKKKYIIMKLCEGAVAMVLTLLFCLVT